MIRVQHCDSISPSCRIPACVNVSEPILAARGSLKLLVSQKGELEYQNNAIEALLEADGIFPISGPQCHPCGYGSAPSDPMNMCKPSSPFDVIQRLDACLAGGMRLGSQSPQGHTGMLRGDRLALVHTDRGVTDRVRIDSMRAWSGG